MPVVAAAGEPFPKKNGLSRSIMLVPLAICHRLAKSWVAAALLTAAAASALAPDLYAYITLQIYTNSRTYDHLFGVMLSFAGCFPPPQASKLQTAPSQTCVSLLYVRFRACLCLIRLIQ